MGQVQTEQLARDYLAFGFKEVAIQDLHSVGVSLSSNSKVRDVVWQYVKENWPMIREKLGGNMVLLERFLRTALSKFASSEQLAASRSNRSSNTGTVQGRTWSLFCNLATSLIKEHGTEG